MSRYATVSLVSYRPLPRDEPDRLRRTLECMGEHVRQAAARKSDLVAFPEICNVLGGPDHWQFEPLDGPTVTAMAAQARKHGLWVVCPLLTLEEGRRRNASVLLDREGRIAGVYHKNVPTHGELDQGIVPGTETPVFVTDFGRVGLCICFDLNYWEVGAGLCANKAELVLWSSMWEGGRMLTRWCIEFGFYLGAICSRQSTFVDVAGREIVSVKRDVADAGGSAPLVTATLDLDRRLLHHDYNVRRLKPLFEKYGPTAAHTEWLAHECILVFGSEMPGVSSDDLIAEFGLETMRDYLARARRSRQEALAGTYVPENVPAW